MTDSLIHIDRAVGERVAMLGMRCCGCNALKRAVVAADFDSPWNTPAAALSCLKVERTERLRSVSLQGHENILEATVNVLSLFE